MVEAVSNTGAGDPYCAILPIKNCFKRARQSNSSGLQ